MFQKFVIACSDSRPRGGLRAGRKRGVSTKAAQYKIVHNEDIVIWKKARSSVVASVGYQSLPQLTRTGYCTASVNGGENAKVPKERVSISCGPQKLHENEILICSMTLATSVLAIHFQRVQARGHVKAGARRDFVYFFGRDKRSEAIPNLSRAACNCGRTDVLLLRGVCPMSGGVKGNRDHEAMNGDCVAVIKRPKNKEKAGESNLGSNRKRAEKEMGLRQGERERESQAIRLDFRPGDLVRKSQSSPKEVMSGDGTLDSLMRHPEEQRMTASSKEIPI
ncbi:hypothetical protein CIHG_10464 [Coccidioides immitis H538.4]|uniref:Uncharacterized protein n=1 Tax=Coccidioides immitis H538.4 TaxID=396776 RepID=A0A0J8S8F8_COCIT|nr:hypothetical protein CIHG_10464 [Coccidioides immitis H538.4]